MNYWNQFFWVIFPYLMIAVTIIGHIFRFNTDQINWSSKSSEFLEKKNLRWGSILFHYGIIFVFFGHILGLLVPKVFLHQIGISNEAYHITAVYFGGAAGIVTVIGLILLLFRRYGNKRISKTSNFADKFVLILLFLVVAFGIYNTIFHNLLVGNFDYRSTISPWFRSLFVFAPDPQLMKNVPLAYKIHIILAFAIFGIWPFTRLVHLWSIPINFIKRSKIIYRQR